MRFIPKRFVNFAQNTRIIKFLVYYRFAIIFLFATWLFFQTLVRLDENHKLDKTSKKIEKYKHRIDLIVNAKDYVSTNTSNNKVYREFFQDIFDLMYVNKPRVVNDTLQNYPKDYENQPGNIYKDRLFITDENYEIVRKVHDAFKAEIPSKMPDGFYSGKGVVILARNEFLPTAVVSVKLLRKMGSDLPAEVFMLENEYDVGICEDILPNLNAKCITIDSVFSKEWLERFNYIGYPLKVLSMLASGFEEIFYLDGDCFPVKKPEIILNEEPYLSNGLITWPDYWGRGTSSYFYRLEGLPLVEKKRDRILPTTSSESGQVVINKRTHFSALILSAYYNLYGGGYYYHILCEGDIGCGDKDTFAPAAAAMKLPFYQVHHEVDTIGYDETSDSRYTFAMAQQDPHNDLLMYMKTEGISEKYATMHTNVHKFSIQEVIKNGDCYGKERDENGNRRFTRRIGKVENIIKKTGFDVELAIWDSIKWLYCNQTSYLDTMWGYTLTENCEFSTKYFDFLMKSTNLTLLEESE